MRLLIILLLLPGLLQARKVRNVLKNGVDNWFQNYDFNQRFGLNDGDTVVLSGDYGDIDMKRVHGITFINEGLVTLKSWTIYQGGQAHNVSLLGNQTPGLKYGIQIKGTRFAIRWEVTGVCDVFNVSTQDNQVGVKITHIDTIKHAFPYLKLTIKDCAFYDASLEAIYIGSDKLTGPFITGKIINCIVKRSGWDAIQCRVGEFEIIGNYCDSIGLAGAAGQDHGILIGGNTKSSVIRDNVVTHVRGYGVFNNGFGEQVIEGNTLEGNIMVQNYGAKTDFQKVGYQKFTIRNNTIFDTDGYALYAYRNNAMPITVVYENNITAGKTNVQPGVVFNVVQPPAKKVAKIITVYSDGSISER